MAFGPFAPNMMFDGDINNPYAAEDFLSRFSAFASAVKWDDAAKVANVGMYLQGTVKDWYKTNAYNDWKTFCDELKQLHSRRFSSEAAENALQLRKKLPTESFDQYYYDIMRLVKQANITDAVKQVRWLIRGLSPSLATQLSARKPADPAAILAIFREWEDLQNLMGLENLCFNLGSSRLQNPLDRSA